MRWSCILLSLALASLAYGSDDPPPTADQQKAILENIGSFVEQYVSTLPNLLCTQTTEQYQSGKKGERWRKGDTLTARLALVSGREKHTLELVNNTPVSQVNPRSKIGQRSLFLKNN